MWWTTREKVAISQFVDFERIYGPEAVSRFNMLKSVNVNGKSNPGFSSDAISGSRSCCICQNLYLWVLWLTREEIIAGTKQLGVLLSLIFVYFLLSPVRKLFSSAINSSFITGWCSWSYWFVYLSGLKTISTSRSLWSCLSGCSPRMPWSSNLPYKGDATEWIWQSGNRRSTSSFTSYFNDLVGLHIWFITIGPASE
jgi:hypothetical protein